MGRGATDSAGDSQGCLREESSASSCVDSSPSDEVEGSGEETRLQGYGYGGGGGKGSLASIR